MIPVEWLEQAGGRAEAFLRRTPLTDGARRRVCLGAACR